MVSHRISAERGLFTHVIWCDEGEAVLGPADAMLSGEKLGEIFKTEL